MPKLILLEEFPIELGRGVDWATGNLKGTVFPDHVEARTTDGEHARKTTFDLVFAENSAQLLETKTSAARASFGNGVFSASGSVTQSLLKQSSTYSVRLFVAVDVQLATETMAKAVAEDPDVDAVEPMEFVLKYGTHFVQGRQRGATLIGVLEIETSSHLERMQLMAELSASGVIGYGQGGGAASHTATLEKILSGKTIKVNYTHVGGQFSPASDTWRDFFSAADNFSTTVTRENAYVREIWLEGYEYVKEISGELGLAVRRIVRDQIYRLDMLALVSSRLLESIGDLKQVIAHPHRFMPNAVEEATDLLPEFEKAHMELLRQVVAVEDDIGHDPKMPSIPLYTRPVEVVPDVIAPPPQIAPRLIVYTGPSKTGERHEIGAGPFPAGLSARIRSLEIVGDFPPNSWWITFRAYTNGPIDFQTFVTPCTVNVLPGLDPLAEPRTYRAFNIMTGREEDILLSGWFHRTTEVLITKNADTSRLPPQFLGMGMVKLA